MSETSLPLAEMDTLASIGFIKDTILKHLEEATPFIDTDWSTPVETTRAEMIRTADGSAVFFSRVRHLEDTELGDSLSISIIRDHTKDQADGDQLSLEFVDDTRLYLDESATPTLWTQFADHTNDEDEVDYGLMLDNADFQGLVHDVESFLQIEMNQPKKEYVRHPIPQEISISPLDDDETESLATRIPEADKLLTTFLPRFVFQPDEGDAWYASKPVDGQGRIYVAFYREIENQLAPFVVYTSHSQGVWRLLPRLGHKSDAEHHDKGVGGDEALNLPIALQRTLRSFNATHPPIRQYFETIFPDLKQLTESTYDCYLSGAESERLWVENEPDFAEWLPKTADQIDESAGFSFSSVLYPQVDARVVTSENEAARYLMLEADRATWVGVAEPVDAKMLDSFILDKTINGRGLYEPPIEYDGHGKDAQYEDNLQRSLGSPAVKAFLA